MPAAVSSPRRLPFWVTIAALVAASTALRAWGALDVPVPWIAPDEMIYGLTGQSLYRSGSLDILGGPTPYYSAVVPAFVGLPLSLGDLGLGYQLLKVLQALAMSLTAVPVYLWGRSLVSRPWAFVAALLTVALPGLVYSGLVMTEVLFYPVLVLAAWASARALEEPSHRRQALLVAAATFAVLTRLQALVLVPAFVTAVGVDAVLQRSARTLRRLAPTLVLALALACAWAGLQLTGGGTGLGGYGVVAHGGYGIGRAARFVLYHAASVTLLAGVLPACALLLLLFPALRRGEPDPRRRAFLAVAASFVLWLVVEVGVFASRYVGQLAERDLIGLAPLLFLTLALWLDRGAPRSYPAALGVGLAVAAPLALLPLGRLVTAYAPPDAPTITALYDLRTATSLGTLEAVFFVAVGVSIAAVVLLPRRLLVVLPLVLAAALAGASVAATRRASEQAEGNRTSFLGPDLRWVDHAAAGPVTYLFDSRTSWVRVWELMFWNRRIESVYSLAGSRVFGPLPQTSIHMRPDGRLVDARGRDPDPGYVVAPLGEIETVPAYAFVGTLVGYMREPGSTVGGLGLWRIEPPLRLSYAASGLHPNGDIWPGNHARLVAYGCGRGVFRLTLLVKAPQTVTILRNGAVYRQLRFRSPGPNQPWRAAIPTVPPPGRARGRASCSIEVRPSGLLGTTVFQVEQ